MTDSNKFTRDALIKNVTAIDETIALMTDMTREALDPAAPRRDVLEAAARAHLALVDARKLLSAAFATVGVRPA